MKVSDKISKANSEFLSIPFYSKKYVAAEGGGGESLASSFLGQCMF